MLQEVMVVVARDEQSAWVYPGDAVLVEFEHWFQGDDVFVFLVPDALAVHVLDRWATWKQPLEFQGRRAFRSWVEAALAVL